MIHRGVKTDAKCECCGHSFAKASKKGFSCGVCVGLIIQAEAGCKECAAILKKLGWKGGGK